MSVQAAIDERVRELVEAHRDQLAELVDQELQRQLALILEERIAARNGNGQPAAVNAALTVAEEPAAAAKLCSVCHEREPAKYRTVCERCRNAARARAKREAAAGLLEADTEPRPARKRNRRGKLLSGAEQAYQATTRGLIAAAPTSTFLDPSGREWVVRHLAPSPTATSPAQTVALHHPRAISRIA